jgi:hypothetical protein
LRPRERRLEPVPLQFHDVQHWCSIIAHNLLSEFWHVYREGMEGRGRRLNATAFSSKELLVTGAGDDDALMHNLLIINGSAHIVNNSSPPEMDGSVKVQVKPPIHCSGRFTCVTLGYIGSYMAELAALLELSVKYSNSREPMPNVLRSILQPQVDTPGDYVDRPILAKGNSVGINQSQRQAVESLQYALEKIQGPPGTGKSTTIFHIISARLPVGEQRQHHRHHHHQQRKRRRRVLVTCSRNVAVESIAQKLERIENTRDRLLVVGNPSRVGATAQKYLLSARCERTPKIKALLRLQGCVGAGAAALRAAFAAKDRQYPLLQQYKCTPPTTRTRRQRQGGGTSGGFGGGGGWMGGGGTWAGGEGRAGSGRSGRGYGGSGRGQGRYAGRNGRELWAICWSAWIRGNKIYLLGDTALPTQRCPHFLPISLPSYLS